MISRRAWRFSQSRNGVLRMGCISGSVLISRKLCGLLDNSCDNNRVLHASQPLSPARGSNRTQVPTRNEGIRPAAACLKIVTLDTERNFASSSAVSALTSRGASSIGQRCNTRKRAVVSVTNVSPSPTLTHDRPDRTQNSLRCYLRTPCRDCSKLHTC
jgi:hypothetical protein